MSARSYTRGRTRSKGTRRRGSVLLMIVGVLALLSIITIAYTAIGAADRRTGVSVQKEASVDTVAAAVKDYLAGVIAEDVLSTIVQPDVLAGEPDMVFRENFDAPISDPARRSATNDDTVRFRPAGSGVDPWLSSTEPGSLRLTVPFNDPDVINEDVTGGDPELEFANWRDWLHISNFAPMGNFVSLYNLRNNFEAGPGFSPGGVPRLSPTGRMSDRLTLLDEQGRPYRVDEAVQLPDRSGGVGIADPNIPAHWTMNQRNLFRPAYDAQRGVMEPEYLLYHYADADGDGMLDSRWFELTEYTTTGNDGGGAINNVRSLLPDTDGLRIFVAARAMDLSGLINVNSSGEFVEEPTDRDPAGASPTDVDLRRVLTLADSYASLPNLGGYSAYEPDSSDSPGQQDDDSQPSDYGDMTFPLAYGAGDAGYKTLRYALDKGGLRSQFVPQNVDPLSAADRYDWYAKSGVSPRGAEFRLAGQFLPDRFEISHPFSLADELELRTFNGLNSTDTTSRLELSLDGWFGAYGSTERQFGPMRSNRPLSIERGLIGDGGGAANNPEFADINDYVVAATDVRRLLTTINGARPIAFTRLDPDEADGLVENEVQLPTLAELAKVRPSATTQTDRREVLGKLARAYFDCLAPVLHPIVWSRREPRDRALVYGRDPELALRAALHMAVNLVDAYDEDDEPSPVSVSLAAAYTNPDQTRFPLDWRINELPVVGGVDDGEGIAPERLAAQITDLRDSSAVNVFGIEAQPMIAEVTTYAFYIDAPASLTGANDGDAEWNNDPDPVTGRRPITLDPQLTKGNPDFLMEVFAVQLYNPFETAITIYNPGDAEVKYYVEYGDADDRRYPLRRSLATGLGFDTSEQITIAPGRSRVFYATNPPSMNAVNARWEHAGSSPITGLGATMPAQGFLRAWADQQFGSAALGANVEEPVHMIAADPLTDLPRFAMAGPSGSVEVVDGGMHGILSDPAYREVVYLWRNIPGWPAAVTSDFLVDRLRDPLTNGRPAALGHRLVNTVNGELFELDGTDAGEEVEGGDFMDNTGMCVTLWGAIRRANGPALGTPNGAMPPWCYEIKDDNEAAGGYVDSLNLSDQAPGLSGRLPSRSVWYDDLSDLISDQVNNAGSTRVNDSISRPPSAKTGNTIPRNGSNQDYIDVATQAHMRILDMNDGLFLRPADFLLPLAVGPRWDPSRWVPPVSSAPETRRRLLDAQWTTFSEALAAAGDYYSPASTANPFHRMARNEPGAGIFPKLDRGNLVLDDYVPFFDSDNDGVFDYDNDDRRIGLGIPAALGILDRFASLSLGDLRTAASGRININTAPLGVLRMLPMLYPTPVAGEWWWDDMHDVRVDIASGIVAYRDKQRTKFTLRGGGGNAVLDFRDDNDGDADPTSATGANGRAWASRIPAIREEPGFRSVGEIMAVRDLADPALTSINQYTRIDRLGFDGATIDHEGVDSSPLRAVLDELEDDYDEKLAVASAVLNSITVRSDVYAVWFVLHGYTRDDCTNLSDTDPLLPSVARRYFMIVDRSNVTKLGQKPRVLLFQEIPF